MFTFQDELDNNSMVRESLHVFHRSEKSRVLSKKKKLPLLQQRQNSFLQSLPWEEAPPTIALPPAFIDRILTRAEVELLTRIFDEKLHLKYQKKCIADPGFFCAKIFQNTRIYEQNRSAVSFFLQKTILGCRKGDGKRRNVCVDMIEIFPGFHSALLLYGIAAISIFIEQKPKDCQSKGRGRRTKAKDSKEPELCMCTYSWTSMSTLRYLCLCMVLCKAAVDLVL